MTRRHVDRISLVVVAVVTCPVAAGLLWAGATGTTAEAFVAAVILVVWFALALPLALYLGCFTDRHLTGLEEEQR